TVVAPAPTLTSFAPTSGPVGTAVVLAGTNFSGATRVTFAGTPAAFTVTSSTRIDTTVPAGASTGRIAVTTPGGTATSASDFTVVAPAPTLTSFAPTSGPVGTAVVLAGTNFSGATRVTFAGTPAAFTVTSSTRIDTTVPAGASTGRIAVTTPGGTATSSSNFTVLPPAPTITSFTPDRGPVGTSVVISGTDFNAATRVAFAGTSASFRVTSSTRIDATVPTGAVSGRITVTTPGGTATSASDFTVLPPAPTLTSFTPDRGPVGNSVVISGTNFSGTTRVAFAGTSASFRVTSSTRIDATVPTGAVSGRITVTTPGGTATSSGEFTVTRPPTIKSFSPASGPPGMQVSIVGGAFTGTHSVRFGGVEASFHVLSPTEIKATVPDGATVGPIRVATADGVAVSSVDFRVTRPPSVDSFFPILGTVGTPVTLTGEHFTGASSVSFNGTASSAFTVLNDRTILVLVPPGARSGKISVSTRDGTGTSRAVFTVLP
ncbi:MAG TPA: IPT/TIG domain-containing protein, partial [Planctomycetota bacterium]